MTKTGRVTLTDRGFQQDAYSALQGDPIRGLIELITNADDAYRGNDGNIQVVAESEVHGFAAAISVFDGALGMTPIELETRLTALGGQNDAFLSGQPVRGNLGRGAKDCAAFGGVLFRTIKDGTYCSLLLRSDSTWELTDPRSATRSDEKNLYLEPGQSGLCASMLFEKSFVRRLPASGNLAFRLGNEAQLRDINRKREVTLRDLRGKQPYVSRVSPQDVGIEKVLVDDVGSVEGYEDSEFHLVLEELSSRSDQNFNSESVQGILICGNKAIYENTFFRLEGVSESRWIKGRLESPTIDHLIQLYDREGPTESNPSRLIQRDRSGLDNQHPFMKNLARQVVGYLQPALDELRQHKGGSQSEGDQLKQKFRVLSNVLKDEIDRMLDEEDNEGDGLGGFGDSQAVLTIIPPRVKVEKNSSFSLTVHYRGEEPQNDIQIDIEGDLARIPSEVNWRQHPRLPLVVTNLQFKSSEPGEALIFVNVGEQYATAAVEVVEKFEVPVPDYSTLHFLQHRSKCKPMGKKNLKLVGPFGIDVVQVMKDAGEGDLPNEVLLRPSEDGLGVVGIVRFLASHSIGETEIHALSGDSETRCTVEVSEDQGRKLPEFDFKVLNQDGDGNRSTVLPGEVKTVIAYGKHRANQSALGNYDEENSRFSREDTPEAMRMLAELYSSSIARYVVGQKAQTNPDDFSDAEKVMARHDEYSRRLVGLALKALETDV